MFPSPLGRHIGHRPFQDLQQSLLDPFPGYIPGNGRILGLPGDLVDFIDINDAPFGPFNVIICILDQPEQDVLHIFPYITGLCEAGGIRNGEGDFQDLGQGLGQKGLAAACRSQHQDIGFLQFHILVMPLFIVDPFVVVVDCHRQGPFGVFLSDDIFVQDSLDFLGFGQLCESFFRRPLQVFFQHFIAQGNTLITDEHIMSGDQFLYLALLFPAERTGIVRSLQTIFIIVTHLKPSLQPGQDGLTPYFWVLI